MNSSWQQDWVIRTKSPIMTWLISFHLNDIYHYLMLFDTGYKYLWKKRSALQCQSCGANNKCILLYISFLLRLFVLGFLCITNTSNSFILKSSSSLLFLLFVFLMFQCIFPSIFPRTNSCKSRQVSKLRKVASVTVINADNQSWTGLFQT